MTALAVTLTQTDAAFTADGLLNFYLTQDTTTVATQTGSPLTFQSGSLPDGIGTQLSPRLLLGQGTFTQVATGHADLFTFALNAAESAYLAGQLDGGGDVRVVIGTADATVSATYDGFTNTTAGPPGPSVTLTTTVPPSAVPEPAALAMAGLGLASTLILAARRRRAA